jgi:hypothetical protein
MLSGMSEDELTDFTRLKCQNPKIAIILTRAEGRMQSQLNRQRFSFSIEREESAMNHSAILFQLHGELDRFCKIYEAYENSQEGAQDAKNEIVILNAEIKVLKHLIFC